MVACWIVKPISTKLQKICGPSYCYYTVGNKFKSLTLSYSSKKDSYLNPYRVSSTLKTSCDMFLEGNVVHPAGFDTLLQIEMANWRTFF
jgi:hypothetical protein